MKLERNVMLLEYSVDWNNSTPFEPATYDYPGNPASYALKITKIAHEDKVSNLRKLKVGDDILFDIEQEIDVPTSVREHRKTGNDSVEQFVSGEASGTILEIENMPEADIDENEYVEVYLLLKDGFGENL